MSEREEESGERERGGEKQLYYMHTNLQFQSNLALLNNIPYAQSGL